MDTLRAGGTADFTYSEVVSLRPLEIRELRPATGGPWGSTLVDREFLLFMDEMLGGELSTLPNSTTLALSEAWEAIKVRCARGRAGGGKRPC